MTERSAKRVRGQPDALSAAVDSGRIPAALGSGFARDYLSSYYCGDVTADELVVLRFLAESWKSVGNVDTFIDLGCGPTIHHLLSAARHAGSLQAFDFLPECIEEVRRWKELVPPLHNWNPWTKAALEAEGEPATIERIKDRESLLRSKLTTLGFCDLRLPLPLRTDCVFNAVGCFYATEQASMVEQSWSKSKRIEAWQQVMANVVKVGAPGGWLFMSCVGYTDHYVTYDQTSKKAKSHHLPYLTEQDLATTLDTCGFQMSESVVRREPVSGQESEGVTDVLLVAAKK